jgi:hypothetical protein
MQFTQNASGFASPTDFVVGELINDARVDSIPNLTQ